MVNHELKKSTSVSLSATQYDAISKGKKLSNRCPLIYDCGRAKGTRWLINNARASEDFASYTYDIEQKTGYSINIENLLKVDYDVYPYIRTISKDDKPRESLLEIGNACPEVIFDTYETFASWFKNYASDCGVRSYYGSKGKHFSECPEFLKWCLEHKIAIYPGASKAKCFAEKILQDYLKNNLSILEQGLKFKEERKFISTGQIDIVAEDLQGRDVILELKARPLTRGAIHKLIGQVSTYYNEVSQTSSGVRIFIIFPKDRRNRAYALFQGLQHWRSKVRCFEFENLKGKYFFKELVICNFFSPEV